MRCSKCPGDSLIFQPYSGLHLCRSHFLLDLEAKAKRDIRAHSWLRPGDHIGVLMTGDKKSLALLHFLSILVANRRDVRVTAIFTRKPEEESPPAGNVQRFMEDHSIGCIYEMATDTDSLTCNLTGTSPLPVKIADRYTITKFAGGRSLDDAALEFFVSLLKGSPEGFFGDDPKALLPVITPFITVPGSEVDLYADVIGGGCIRPPPEPPACRGFEQVLGDALDNYTERHPATKYSLLQISERIRLGKKRGDAGPDPGPAGENFPGSQGARARTPGRRPAMTRKRDRI
ncbi:MAG: hypothetical protein METHP_00909 [Methanoregula sp. SKADARSKE-2]|nr:MAG: hypothetical protein METHP_00909 [Methanoregula sp. SKADARSKE-2]